MIIVTAAGSDTPGMAFALSHALYEADCNIEDATMTRLSGVFAMILAVSPPADLDADALQTRLAPLRASHGLNVHCEAVDAAAETAGGTRFMLSAYGPERGGLLAGVTRVLAAQGVNITDVQTRVASGGAAYVMLFELDVPPAVAPDALESALQAAAAPIGVKITLRALEEDTL